MVVNDRGMALVSVIVILAVLMTLSHILFEKTWHSIRQCARADSREQIFWAAQSGIETARERLTKTYATSSHWANYLLSSQGVYPSIPTWSFNSPGAIVEIFLRDNPDGDGSYLEDNDLKIFVLSRARNRQGAEVFIETLCGFEPPPSRGGGRPGHVVNQHLDLTAAQASVYEIYE